MKKAAAFLFVLCMTYASNFVEGADQNFKLRVGENGLLSEEFIVGSRPDTNAVKYPVTVDRFRGTDPLTINLSYNITWGDPQYWTITMDTQPIVLGSGSEAQRTLEMALTAAPGTPEGAEVNIEIKGVNGATNESHSAYAHVVKKSYGVSIDVLNYIDLTSEKTSKLTYGRTVTFDLAVVLKGANPDVVTLIPQPISGFSFQTVGSNMKPLTTFALAPRGFSESGFPPAGRRVQLQVTTPLGWPRGEKATVSLNVKSLSSDAQSTIDLDVIKAAALWTPSDLLTSQGRRHFMRSGTSTSYLLTITNISSQPKTLSLLATRVAPSPGWNLQFSTQQVTLNPSEQTEVKVTMTAPANAAVDTISDWNIALTDYQGFTNLIRVGAEVTNMRKIIYVAVDGLQPEYMYLNAKGTGPGSSGDWLMPNVQQFIGRSTTYKNAFDSLPSTTDANHVNALSGCRSGQTGIPAVFYCYYGRDANGATVSGQGDSSILRYGPEGKPLLTAFDVAKHANPKAYTAIATGKNWMAKYFQKEQGGVDLVLNGRNMPPYIKSPSQYTLGDPSTDLDPQDPSPKADFANWGAHPGLFPDDRWIMNGAMRLIDNEDPDVIYILLGAMDDVQHQCGTSWDSAEWDDNGTESLWDDINLISPLGVRDEPLDVAREVDNLFGNLLNYLYQRGTLTNSYVVLLSDHGFMTSDPNKIDLRRILDDAGLIYKEDYDAFGGGGLAMFYGVRPEQEGAFEAALENAPLVIPELTRNPWVVLNRAEMKTGVDQATGRRVAGPRELYSEFYIEHEVLSTDQQKWPSFYVFFDGLYQSESMFMQAGEYAEWGRYFVGNHGGLKTNRIALVAYGPGFQKGKAIIDDVSIADISPTLYHLQGWPTPESVEGKVLPGLE
jgi:predicted AlkP superfamily pyrophosphatase or phosphodiesterase